MNLSFHVDFYCGCTGKHSYQQMFRDTGQSYLEERCIGHQNTCDVEVQGVILEGIRGESEQGEMREVDQLKLAMYKNVLRKPIVYMLIKK